MGRIIYLVVMAICWALTGVATNVHKGAVLAATVGFIWMFFMALWFIKNWDDTDTATPYARVVSIIVFWVSFPIALIVWGNEAVQGGGALQIIFWFGVAAIVIRGITYGVYRLEQKTGIE